MANVVADKLSTDVTSFFSDTNPDFEANTHLYHIADANFVIVMERKNNAEILKVLLQKTQICLSHSIDTSMGWC